MLRCKTSLLLRIYAGQACVLNFGRFWKVRYEDAPDMYDVIARAGVSNMPPSVFLQPAFFLQKRKKNVYSYLSISFLHNLEPDLAQDNHPFLLSLLAHFIKEIRFHSI